MQRLIVGIIILIGAVAFNFAYKAGRSDSQQAEILKSAWSSEEEQFDEPRPVVWRGKIVGCFESCAGYFVKDADGIEGYSGFKFYVPKDSNELLDGYIEVEGQWTGIDCSYASVFEGVCTPIVEAKLVKSI